MSCPIIIDVIVFATEYDGSRDSFVFPFKYFSKVISPFLIIRKALVLVFDKNSSKEIFSPPHVTTVGVSEFEIAQSISDRGAAFTQWPGNKFGVLEAGARANLIAAIGSGYLMALVKPKSAR
jgi:hypothetical protein